MTQTIGILKCKEEEVSELDVGARKVLTMTANSIELSDCMLIEIKEVEN